MSLTLSELPRTRAHVVFMLAARRAKRTRMEASMLAKLIVMYAMVCMTETQRRRTLT